MANGNGTTTAEAIKAIRDTNGFVSQAAKRLGLSRMQLYRIINSHPTVKEALEDAREETKDFAEAQLFKNIKSGKEASIFFFLKTQAKDRGYIERQEVTGADGGALTFRIIYDDDGNRVQDSST